MGMTPPNEELIESFVKYALIYYCRGVLQGRFDCTEEWKSCAKHVLSEVMER